LLKRQGSKLIALVGNVKSYLAEQSDYILNATVEAEADPNNLAPTCSTTATLALADALAICLIEQRGFTKDDFARFHPGGALGKKLYLKVKDVYLQHETPVVKESDDLKSVILEITSKRLGATAVVDDNGKIVGIVTDGDLRRMLHQRSDYNNLTAKDVLSTNPKVIEESAYAVKALTLMEDNNITQLIVVKNGELAGFIHLHDLLKEGLV
jgi:arabinose-5-phosphate isomerase